MVPGVKKAKIRPLAILILGFLGFLSGCATRPVNPPITQIDPSSGYRFDTRHREAVDQENLVILAFSGGGTRAAAFSYGVLEFLRRAEMVMPNGKKIRMLDEIDVITGVSGGSFTALSYALYGDKLFDDYEKRFLKRNVQGEIVSRVLSPTYWPSLASTAWGGSEIAANLYDEILFNNATFGDLNKGPGPMVLVGATDITTGSRFTFHQAEFDAICSDISKFPLSRAAAASSAVPVVLSPVTLNNYGGTCNWTIPAWLKPFSDADNPSRPAARLMRTVASEQAYADGANRPYLHLVDGGVSDNVGMRNVLDSLEMLEALYDTGIPTPLDKVRRIIVFVVNSVSTPKTNWDKYEEPPGTVDILLKAAGTPIDHNSWEAIELLKDTAARWRTARLIKNSAAMKNNKDPAIDAAIRAPMANIYTIDVSFHSLDDSGERDYLNQLPTSFVLDDEAVDRLRAAAGKIIANSPAFKRLQTEVSLTVGPDPIYAPPRPPKVEPPPLGG